ncbi:MAG: sigma 54-interacting transcriptional regulator, partial [Myxococcota bacterium]
VPEGLIESELFGHEKGAFTGATNARTGLVEAAHRGTLFLDEVAELPLSAQARLLRVVQESEVRRVGSNTARRVDVRLVAATHRDLNTMVRRGEFRQDLYFRLKVLELTLPPLRERGNDILELAEAFLNATARRMNARVQFSPRAHEAMLAYPWPGNVRELRHAIERAVILHEDGWLTPDLLGLDQQTAQAPQLGLVNPLENVSLEDYFRAFVLQNQGHMTETELAESLGISRKTLWERRKRMGIPRKTS